MQPHGLDLDGAVHDTDGKRGWASLAPRTTPPGGGPEAPLPKATWRAKGAGQNGVVEAG